MQLFQCNRRRSFAHGVDSVLRLREGDDVTDGLAFEHEHDHAVQTECQAAMGRCTVFESTEEEAEFLFCFFRRQADGFKDALLDVGLVDTQGAAAEFDAVEYDRRDPGRFRVYPYLRRAWP